MEKKNLGKSITKKAFIPKRCHFLVETNNLVTVQMLSMIIDKFEKDAIDVLNTYLKSLKFYVGGKQWHSSGQKGFLKLSTSEIDFNSNSLLFYISKIFELGYKQWSSLSYGALRRFLWESFFHEIIQQLCSIVRLDLTLANEAKDYDLYKSDKTTLNFINNFFNHNTNSSVRINFITMSNTLWNDQIPESLGFLDILYRRRLNKLKQELNADFYTNNQKIKFFNELRKSKLKYKYEYNLSELINYCIHNDHFQKLFDYDSDTYIKLQRDLYSKAKRIILKFFEKHGITHELHLYKDSADRTHYFLTHETFERVKSACLQNCIAEIKNKILILYDLFIRFYSICPICKRANINQDICEKLFFSSKYRYFKSILLEKMIECEFNNDLNNDEYYFGIPCEPCFHVIKNIQGKYTELNELQKFMVRFNRCPICGARNHNNYLISLYYNEKKKEINEYLIDKRTFPQVLKNYNINIGIPCCNCFELIFGKQFNLEELNLSSLF